MAEDWAADVKKYVADADDAIIAGIVRYCGIALRKVDSSLVAFSDKKETDRVRENFLKKKLGLTDPDAKLDAAIAAVGERMKADRTKNRVTVYYLLADNFGKLGLFAKAAKAGAAAKPAAKEKAPAKAKAPAKEAAPAKAKAPAKAAAAPAKAKAPVKAAAKVSTKKAAPKAATAGGGAALGLASLGDGAKAAPASSDEGSGGVVAGAAAALGAAGAAVTGAAGSTAAGAADMAGKVADVVSDAASGAADTAAKAGAAVAGAAGAAVGGAAALAGKAGDTVGGAVSGLSQAVGGSDDEGGSGWNWFLMLLLVLAVLIGIWALFFREKLPADVEGVNIAPYSEASGGTPAPDLAAAPAEGTVEIPAGAGVTSEKRDGKPVVKVYFDTGKTDVAAAFTATAEGLKAWLASNQGSSLAISGYNDPSGNAAANAELSKQRAQAVQAALIAAGVPESSAELVKPENTADTTVPKEAARRVEVVVR